MLPVVFLTCASCLVGPAWWWSVCCQVVICVLHLQRTFVDEGWFSVLVATQQVLLWMKLVSRACVCVCVYLPLL